MQGTVNATPQNSELGDEVPLVVAPTYELPYLGVKVDAIGFAPVERSGGCSGTCPGDCLGYGARRRRNRRQQGA